jgi:hypothetical protein
VQGIKPVFLSGVYRSGTTILAQVIGAHREIAITFDSVKFLRFCLHRYSPIDDPDNRERLVRETHDRIALRWDMHFDVDAMTEAVLAAGSGYAPVYDVFMQRLLLTGDGAAKRWGEKTAVMWSRIPDFLTMFPDAKVIHVMRDPRDATASYKKLTYEPGYTYLDCAVNSLHAMQSISEYQDRFGKDRVYWIRMEDLVSQPEQAARAMCEFLELDFDPGMIDPTRFRDKAGKPWDNNSVFCPNMTGISGDFERWRTELTTSEVLFVEMLAASQMSKFGYHGSGSFPARADWNEVYEYLEDPFIRKRFERWLSTGKGSEGYRSDPIAKEIEALSELKKARVEGSAE